MFYNKDFLEVLKLPKYTSHESKFIIKVIEDKNRQFSNSDDKNVIYPYLYTFLKRNQKTKKIIKSNKLSNEDLIKTIKLFEITELNIDPKNQLYIINMGIHNGKVSEITV